jgi:hypothetical protein
MAANASIGARVIDDENARLRARLECLEQAAQARFRRREILIDRNDHRRAAVTRTGICRRPRFVRPRFVGPRFVGRRFVSRRFVWRRIGRRIVWRRTDGKKGLVLRRQRYRLRMARPRAYDIDGNGVGFPPAEWVMAVRLQRDRDAAGGVRDRQFDRGISIPHPPRRPAADRIVENGDRGPGALPAAPRAVRPIALDDAERASQGGDVAITGQDRGGGGPAPRDQASMRRLITTSAGEISSARSRSEMAAVVARMR